MKLVRILSLAALLTQAAFAVAQNSLANNTVLIVRHAEKSPTSGRGLTPQGEARAQLYSTYFEPFHEDGITFKPDVLYAGKDSKNSMRPRLTLEPLSKATGMPLDTRFETDDPESLAKALRTETHGSHPLVAWRHGEIPALIAAFGGSPKEMIPGAKWPDDVYDWVIVLTFDANGNLSSQKLIHEHLDVPKS